jgi:hypothetical protein
VGTALLRRPAGELAAAAVGLTILAFVAFEPYVRSGGFVGDEWISAADTHLRSFGDNVDALFQGFGRRPLAALYFPVVHSVLGLHQHLHLALAAAERTGLALALFLVLRRLGIDRVAAGATAALCLLFPFSDSTWLWSAGGQISVSALAWLLGVLAALRGLRSPTRGRAWHGLAVGLYLASILLYEITLIAVLLSGLLYLRVAPRRLALRRWATDAAALALAVLLFTSQTIHLWGHGDRHRTQGLSGAGHHARVIADQGLTLSAQALVPFGSPARWAVAAAALLLAGAGTWVAARTRDATLRVDLTRWLSLAAAGVVVTIAGWVLLVFAGNYYAPLAAAIGNRINVLAAVGLPLVAIGLARVGAALAFARAPRRRPVASAVLTIVMAVAVAGAYLDRVGADRGTWARASQQANRVVASVGTSMPRPPHGSTVMVRGFPLWEAPNVPVFAATWDLTGAVRLLWHDLSLTGWPLSAGGLHCAPAGASVSGIAGASRTLAPYARTFLVDASTGTSTRVTGVAACRALGGS